MKRKRVWIPTLLILIVLAGLAGAGQYFYGIAINSNSEAVDLHGGKNEAETVTASVEEEESLLEHWTSEQNFENLEIETSDELKLKAVYLENENPNGKTVVLAHGYKGNKEQLPGITKFYYEQGFHILKPDARGHGESEGQYIGYGWHDRLDFIEWVDLLIEEKGAESLILHGFSMGAATVLMTSGEELPEEVQGVIADSAYTSVEEELAHQMKNLYGIPSFPILQVTSLITDLRAGYNFNEASTLQQVKQAEVPIFFIHGAEDVLVPTDMATELYKAAGGEKELWIVPEATHTEGYTVAKEDYQERIMKFINGKDD
ncbi:peptidase [Pontibacillus halophilus JSM 076056 = DSM 19796]|uniref:Peptidase n=1 Tax=Pontibacillus halophilus JSM 076056 = DSM 19796 TaxID=1385510 RepID=A0A0A5I0B7_9BACI|nr:alpha/beta hydrolase [Pontibacillus halophilus]KGX89297.1 peptidase [Pontibacillus halophilus JSM 076056 = DSM 19796]